MIIIIQLKVDKQHPNKQWKQKKTNRGTNTCRAYYDQFVHITYSPWGGGGGGYLG